MVALDLISQAEHSDDTFCFLLTTSQDLAERGGPDSRVPPPR